MIVPARASRRPAAATARWRAKARGTTPRQPTVRLHHDPIVLEHRVLNRNTVEVLTYLWAARPASIGDNGVKTYHPLVNGTTVIKRWSACDDGKTLVAWAGLIRPFVPHRVFARPIAQSYFDDTPVPPGFKRCLARAWYRVEWAERGGGTDLDVRGGVERSAGGSAALRGGHTRDVARMQRDLISRDFSLAYRVCYGTRLLHILECR